MMKRFALPILVSVMFLQGCVSTSKEEVDALRKENQSLKEECNSLLRSVLQRELENKGMEYAIAKKDLETQLVLMKKDSEMRTAMMKKEEENRNNLIAEKMKALERTVAEKDKKLKNSVSVDLFFKSSDPYNYQLPGEILDIWLSRNKPPENPSRADLRAFADKIPSVIRYCNNSQRNQQKLLAVTRGLPEDFLRELIRIDNQNTCSMIFSDAAQRMDKETLKQYMKYSEGSSSSWNFANRFWQLADEKDKDLIMKNFWNNQVARQKAVKYGFHKEIMTEIKKRFMENPGSYPDLQSVVLPQLTPEEKNDMANRIWTTIRSKRGDMWQMFNPAQLFLECGFVPAFVQIALISPYVRNYDNSKIRLIEKYSPVGIMDLQDWVIKNYGNIVFDSKTKKFVAGDRKEQKK